MVSAWFTRRLLLRGTPLLWFSNAQIPAAEEARTSSAVEKVLDRIVENEAKLLKLLAERTPIVETYIQESLGAGGEIQDHYFLGKISSSGTLGYTSLLKRQSAPAPLIEQKIRTRFGFLRKIESTEEVPQHLEYLPEGFVYMATLDGHSFNRATYQLTYVRREFLGEVRCLVFDVAPVRQADPGRFVGRIWVEDAGYAIVRLNGSYNRRSDDELYFHFDSWRVYTAPGIWVPAAIYIEDSVLLPDADQAQASANVRFKGQTRLWAYHTEAPGRLDELTAILVEGATKVKDSAPGEEISPIDGQRRWEREAEENVLERLERVGLLAPRGEIDKILTTVLNNIAVTNALDVEAQGRVLLTTPFESFTVGRTVVVSRGLMDVLPDEASLALVLATELAHISLGHPTRTEYAFHDRTMVKEDIIVDNFRFERTPEEVTAACAKAVLLLAQSPYKDKMSQAGLFLKALKVRSGRYKHLIRATLGNDLTRYLDLPEFEQILAAAPPLEEGKLEQIAALPLGSRIRVEPWANRITLMKSKPVALLSAREKMPFEVTPAVVHLSRAAESRTETAGQ